MLKTYETLLREFGPQGWWPLTEGFPPEWEVMVGAVLTQNAAWKNVEKALHNLKREGVTSREATLKVSEERLAELVRPSGYYNQKARKLRILAGFEGKPTRENLLGLWGVGPETADTILLYGYGKPEFVVDAYTRRVFTRTGALRGTESYQEIKDLFEAGLPRKVGVYKEFHALIVELAKRHCRVKPACSGCPLKGDCRHGKP